MSTRVVTLEMWQDILRKELAMQEHELAKVQAVSAFLHTVRDLAEVYVEVFGDEAEAAQSADDVDVRPERFYDFNWERIADICRHGAEAAEAGILLRANVVSDGMESEED